jgi:hypothetical protein
MSDTNAPEPTMEEILASIRRIISEDEPSAQASSESDTGAAPEGDLLGDDILELTERVDGEADDFDEPGPESEPTTADYESSGDLDIYARAEPLAPAPAPAPAPAYDDDSGLVGAPAAQSASSAFGQLARTVAMPSEGRVLEDVVRELLRPLLKDWLDRNLSGIVEEAVQAEVERIARRRIG